MKSSHANEIEVRANTRSETNKFDCVIWQMFSDEMDSCVCVLCSQCPATSGMRTRAMTAVGWNRNRMKKEKLKSKCNGSRVINSALKWISGSITARNSITHEIAERNSFEISRSTFVFLPEVRCAQPHTEHFNLIVSFSQRSRSCRCRCYCRLTCRAVEQIENNSIFMAVQLCMRTGNGIAQAMYHVPVSGSS